MSRHPAGQRADALIDLVRAECAHAAASHLHGDGHWRCVAATGARLIEAGEPADPAVVRHFALLHDCRRLDDGEDPEHGPRAAAYARRLAERGLLALSDEQLDLLVRACRDHTGATTTTDPTIGVCWDADRLNLPRVGITVDPAYLSTLAALDEGTIAWAATLHAHPPTWAEALRQLA